MPAVLAAERARALAGLELVHLLLEGLDHLAGRLPAEIAAGIAGAGVIGMLAGQLAEIGAVLELLGEIEGTRAGLLVGGQLVRLDQDVTGTRLGDHLAVGAAAASVHAQDVVAAGGLDHRRHGARLEIADRPGEGGRQVGQAPPAEIAAFQRLLAVGMGGGKRCEVRAGFELALQFLGARAGFRALVRAGAVADRDQDVREIDLGIADVLLLRQIGVDVLLADADARLELARAQALRHDLVADLLAHGEIVAAFAPDLPCELGLRHAVALGDVGDDVVELAVVDADAGIAGALGLDAHEDEALEDLVAELAARHVVHAALAQLLLGVVERCFVFAVQDDAVVDDDEDAVDGRDGGDAAGARQRGDGE